MTTRRNLFAIMAGALAAPAVAAPISRGPEFEDFKQRAIEGARREQAGLPLYCANCGDDIDPAATFFCGMCREMGCGILFVAADSAEESLLLHLCPGVTVLRRTRSKDSA